MSSTDGYDIVIIGGGITGAGIARDAVLRGLRVALFEKNDFGSGTSSKSSKLIHGGLRYLEHGEIGMVFESVSERAVQSKMAPHLVRPLPFLVPIYQQNKPGLEIMNVGLWIYDTLSLFRAPKLHKTFRGKKARELAPWLQPEGLRGAIEYYDCVTDDARLVLENVIDAVAHGADCHSYSEVVELERKRDERVAAVVVRDRLTGEQRKVPTRAVILAAGPWTDEVTGRFGVDTGRRILRCTKGVHLVFAHEKLPIRRAIAIISPVDGRAMFAIPWHGRTVIGTTDTDFEGSADEVHADREDVDYLCASANSYFPDAHFQPADVLATWAGLRPLINQEDVEEESDVSREHEIYVRDDGVTIIAGGKLTTYRRMAKEVVRATVRWLRKNDDDFTVKLKKPHTKIRPLPGGAGLPELSIDGVSKLARRIADEYSVDFETADHLTRIYGGRAPELAELIDHDDELGERIEVDLPYVWAEIPYAVEHDLARTVTDVLARRVPLLLVGADQGLDVAERVAARMAPLLGWTPEQGQQSVEDYRRVVADSRQYR